MERETRGRLIRNTLFYGAVASVLAWLILYGDYTLGDFTNFLPYLPPNIAAISLSAILVPALGSITIIYFASLSGLAFEGPIARSMVGAMYAAGMAVFFGLFLMMVPGSENLRRAGLLFMAAFGILVLNNILSTLSRIWKVNALRVLGGSATIYAVGQLFIQLIGLFMGPTGSALPEGHAAIINDMINFGFTAAAVISLLGLFKTSQNPYLAALGDFTSSYFFVLSFSLIGSLYVNLVWGELGLVYPPIQQLSPYIEWTGIVVVAALIFTIMRRGMRESLTAPTEVGEWAKHVQDVSITKGEELVGFTEMVDEFVEAGRRERLLVRMFNYLEENRVPEADITRTLSGLINYEDERPPAFAWRGRISAVERENERKRLETLKRTVNRITSLGVERPTILKDGIDAEVSGSPSSSMDQVSRMD